jgi:hypothetical protein
LLGSERPGAAVGRSTTPIRGAAATGVEAATRPSGFPLKNVLQSSNMNPN